MSRSLRILSVLALAMLALVPRVAAQCTLSDGLDGGPCCAITAPNIPYVQGFKQDTLDICWQNCGVSQTRFVRGVWVNVPFIAGTTSPCGEQEMRLDLRSIPGNVLLWRGRMRLTYSRTFAVVDTSGFLKQVWRFLVNGDLVAFAAGLPPCPVPSCVPAFNNRARYTGYLDITEDCSVVGSPAFEHAWMLTHACDFFDHQAGFPRAGIFHPDRSFSFVAPAAGFVPGPLQPTEGTLFSPFEAVRSRTPSPAPVTLQCNFEEAANHTLTPQNQLCFCGLGASQFMFGDIQVVGACGTFVRNPPGGPLLPGFVSMGLGAWTNPLVYPGVQNLRWNAGAYDYADACLGTPSFEVFFGVTTIGGYPALQLVGGGVGGPLPPIFIDQGSSQAIGGTATVMNVRYQSHHILNLNH